MKILIFGLFAHRGGGRVQLLNLARYKPASNLFAYFLITRSQYHTMNWPAREDIKYIVISDFFGKGIPRVIFENAFIFLSHFKCRDQVLFFPGGIAPIVARIRKNYITMFRNVLPFCDLYIAKISYFDIQFYRNKFIAGLIRSTLKNSRKNIFISMYGMNLIKSRCSLHDRDCVVHHGVDIKSIRRARGRDIPPILRAVRYVLYPSYLEVYKNQCLVIEAFLRANARLKQEYYLVLVGEPGGFYGKQILERIKDLPSIIYLNAVPQDDVWSLGWRSELNVFASSVENCPNILLELMHIDVPILCLDAGPASELCGNSVEYFSESVEDLESKLVSELTVHDKKIARDDESALVYDVSRSISRVWSELNV